MGDGRWEVGDGRWEMGVWEMWGVWEDGDIIVKLIVVSLLAFGNSLLLTSYFLLLTPYFLLPTPYSLLLTFH